MAKFADRFRIVYDRAARCTCIEFDGVRVGGVTAVNPRDAGYSPDPSYAFLLQAEVVLCSGAVKAFSWDVEKLIPALARRVLRAKAHIPSSA